MINKILNIKILQVILLVVSGGITLITFAPLNIWWLIFPIMFILIFVVNYDYNFTSSPRLILKTVFINSYIFGFGFFFANLYWTYVSLHEVINLNAPISVLLHILFALFLASYVGLAAVFYRLLKINHKSQKIQIVNLMFLIPTCWVLCEILRGKLFTGFSWYNISYIAMNIHCLHGFFPLGGEYLVSWIFLSIIAGSYILINMLLNSQISHQALLRIRDKKYAVIIVLYIFFIILFGHALSKIQYTIVENKTVKLALIQGNNSVTEKWNFEYFHGLLNKYAQMVAASKSADIIIMPETAISVFPSKLPDNYLDDLIRLANNSQVIIGMPMPLDHSGESYSNAAILLNNFTYYTKQHLVPYGEYIPLKSVLGSFYQNIALPMVNFQADASHNQTVNVKNIKLAFNLCYENGFGEELITTGKVSQIMVNLSDMVWYKDTWAKDHHLQMSIARTLENQRYWVQDTNSGLTAIIDPQGQIVAQLPANVQDILFYSVPLVHGSTPYQRIGDNLINLLLIINLLAFLLLRYLTK